MVREPFALVVSYYLHHRSGEERERNPAFQRVWELIRTAPPAAGVLHIAQLALDGQLQLMAHNHQYFAGRDDVLTMRLDSTQPYEGRMRRFAERTGVNPTCASPGSDLQRRLARHDVTRWSAAERLTAEHVNDELKVARESWRNKTVLHDALEGSGRVATRLRALGRRLGYTYPGGLTSER